MWAALIANSAAAAPASESTPDSCTFRHPVVEVGGIEDVPRTIQMAILRQIDPVANQETQVDWRRFMAPRGGAFNPTDVIDTNLPTRRFIRAGHVEKEWFVWFERGGVAHVRNIVLFHLRAGYAPPIRRAFVSYSSQDPCVITDELLDNKPPSPDLGPGAW